eukprot:comp54193_c0_seq1/m.47739 comp54193_c0_seq1/g.47739  ORF comp54193_c0_seq1/g.47739 comp54193_c0_seq1/m.47739 type:complete len:666 (-) comp54193_c0_seq1:66-2063(-)
MVFVSVVNPVTKKVEWVEESDDYGFEDEVAVSMFGDMLHDDERNELYKESITRVMKSLPENSKVLDIGTGTGLLGLFSAAAGAGYVYGCELFEPMAEVATQTIKASPYKDKMTVFGKRSTEVTVGPNGDMPERADIVVAELLDTELIGEGCLPTYRDAKKRLLKQNAKSVPMGATMYCQLISSERLWAGHKIPQLPGMDQPLPPCTGTHQTQNIQANTYKNDIVCYSEPFKAFTFDFMNVPPSDVETIKMTCNVPVTRTGNVQAVLYWWVLHLDEVTDLSTAPDWVLGREGQWRDHWMQAVCFMPAEVSVTAGTEVPVACAHDDFSMWFSAYPQHHTGPLTAVRPDCTCHAHLAWNHSRIGMLNDQKRKSAFKSALGSVLTPDSVCLCVSDGSYPALVAAFEHGCRNTYAVEDTPLSRRLLSTLIPPGGSQSSSGGKITIIGKSVEDLIGSDLDGHKVDVLVAEPYFLAAVLPWQHVYLWYARERLSPHLSPTAKILPGKATLRAAAVWFKDLWKSHDNIGSVCGLDLTAFQVLLDRAGSTRGGVHTYQVAEYVHKHMTEAFDLLTFDFNSTPVTSLSQRVVVDFKDTGDCHGVLLWMDYELVPGTTISTSPTDAPYMKQAAFMFHDTKFIAEGVSAKLIAKADFDKEIGNVTFDFQIRESGDEN